MWLGTEIRDCELQRRNMVKRSGEFRELSTTQKLLSHTQLLKDFFIHDMRFFLFLLHIYFGHIFPYAESKNTAKMVRIN